MKSETGFTNDLIDVFQISQLICQIAYISLVIPYYGTSDTFLLDKQNIIHLFDLYDHFCSDERFLEYQNIYQLP